MVGHTQRPVRLLGRSLVLLPDLSLIKLSHQMQELLRGDPSPLWEDADRYCGSATPKRAPSSGDVPAGRVRLHWAQVALSTRLWACPAQHPSLLDG